jgi:hypothetical protein
VALDELGDDHFQRDPVQGIARMRLGRRLIHGRG